MANKSRPNEIESSQKRATEFFLLNNPITDQPVDD